MGGAVATDVPPTSPRADHLKAAEQVVARVVVITLSDTRTPDTDRSGQAIAELLAAAGHAVVERVLIRDEAESLRAALASALARADVDAVITTGGTGIMRRDVTIPVVMPLISTPLPGFGELFRMLSWEQVGPAAMLSRAAGGVAHGKLLFALPGSTQAVELAMSKLIIPELKHLIRELRR